MQGFLIHAGYPAIILLAFLEACCIPISSEVIFGFAGVLAYQGHLNLALVIIVGTLAELAGSFVSYSVGRVAERPLIERLGRYLLITRRDIDRSERFLAGRGSWAIPVGRVLPVLRSFTSLVAGHRRGAGPPLRAALPHRHRRLRGRDVQHRLRRRAGLEPRRGRPLGRPAT